jgi:hypothetical protein
MWTPLTDERFGLLKLLSDSISDAYRADPRMLPNLHDADTLIVTSDYSGQHKSSRFEAYAFLFAGPAWLEWERRRLEARRIHHAEGRRLSFKKLGDAVKQRMLPDFLQAASVLPGLCVCVLVDKAIPSMFRKEGTLDLSAPDLAPYTHHRRATFEKLLRVVHMTSFFLAGLTRPGQNVVWFTDQDDIAANAGGVAELTGIWANVMSNMLQHTLGHLRCGTTECDNGTLQIEDLAALPDLVAGSLADAVNNYFAEGTLPSEPILTPPPAGVSSKAREIINWLSEEDWPLRKLVFCFEAIPDSTALSFKRIRFHGTRSIF